MNNTKYLMKVGVVCLLSTLLSCNNSADTVKNEVKTDSIVPVATTPPPVEMKTVKLMLIQHTVTNYDRWKLAFDADDSTRKAYGASDMDLLRAIDNPNKILIVDKIDDVQRAKEFAMLPSLKEKMMKAGVKGMPDISYLQVIRNDDSKIDTKETLMVTHKVKDFDTWLKAYDAEGKETRLSQGMVDRALARSVDDANNVYILFAITDMSKAKAALVSESKKKIMMDAGVEGKPVIEFFRQSK